MDDYIPRSKNKGFISGVFGTLLVLIVLSGVALSQKRLILEKLISELQPYIVTAPVHTNDEDTQQVFTSQEFRVIETVKKAAPAVVSVVISKDVPIMERFFEEGPSDPFGDFFGSPFEFRIPQFRERGTEHREVGGGSGFLVSSDGLIITNRHVIDQEEADYTVFTNDGKKYEAEIIAKDPVHDLAILKIQGDNFSYLNFGQSDSLQVGQTVIAIGNALAEFRNSVSVGIVSGLSRSITAGNGIGQSELLEGVIQTDAAINPGNSGGPLLNLGGEVIGVNVAVASGVENIGFALPGNLAQNVVDSVERTGRIVRPYLGVRYLQINERVKGTNQLTIDYGALVVRGENPEELAVIPGSPADKAGIVENDIILEVNGTKLDDAHSLASEIRKKSVGDEVTLKILHDGEEKSVKAKLAELPS